MSQKKMKLSRKVMRKEAAKIIKNFVRATNNMKFSDRIKVALSIIFRRKK